MVLKSKRGYVLVTSYTMIVRLYIYSAWLSSKHCHFGQFLFSLVRWFSSCRWQCSNVSRCTKCILASLSLLP